jgi:hypothetical protein
MWPLSIGLTTPREDRDGDTLETAGANVDPKAFALATHPHGAIGKLMRIIEQNKDSSGWPRSSATSMT